MNVLKRLSGLVALGSWLGRRGARLMNECYEFIDAHIIIFIARSFFTEHLGLRKQGMARRKREERKRGC